MFEQQGIRSNEYTPDEEDDASPSPRARSTRVVVDEARGLTQQLRALPARPILEEAWLAYTGHVSQVRANDLQDLGELESAIEGRSEFPEAPSRWLFASTVLLSERVGDELRDAWARLRARELVDGMKKPGKSLRAIHEDVGVSTPYLSQLANGTGPVPSDKILDRLVAGLRRQGTLEDLPSEHGNDPARWVGEMGDRARLVRNHLRERTELRPTPTVHIEGLPDRQQHRLELILTNLVERCIDQDGGSATASLLQELVDGDEARHDVLLEVARSEVLVNIVSHLTRLDGKGLQGLLALLESQVPPAPSLDRQDLRSPKQPVDRM